MKRAVLALVAFMLATIGSAELNFQTLLPERKWALCVGASNYQSITKLKYAGRDAVAFSKFLVQYGFRPDEVITLSDEPGYQPPTAKNFYQRLDEILKDPDLEQGDQFIVYFSGHGVGLADGDYWLPTDADPKSFAKNAISIRQVIKRLSDAKLKSVTILSDACRAGDKNSFGRELIRLGKTTNIAVLLGCAPGAKSYELPSKGQGAFTYYLTRSLQNEALADPETGAVWVSKIGQRVSEVVKAATTAEYGKNRQEPVVYADAAQDVAFGLVVSQDPTKQLASAGAQKLDKWQRYSVVSKLAKQLTDAGKDEEAVACYKALEALGYLSDAQLLTYSLCLGRLNREYERRRIFDRFIAGKPLTNRRAALTLLMPRVTVSLELLQASVSKLKDKIADPFDEISFLTEVQLRTEVPKPTIAKYLRQRLAEVKLSNDERQFLEARLHHLEGKSAEAYRLLRPLVDSKLDRAEVVNAMIYCLDESRLSDWMSVAKGTKGLGAFQKEYLLLAALKTDRQNLRSYVTFVLDEGISPIALLKMTPQLLYEKAITMSEITKVSKGSDLSFEHRMAQWFISCITRDKYGDQIPEEVFQYGASRTQTLAAAFDLWMTFASIEKWKPDEYKDAWEKKKEILSSFRPHLEEIASDTKLLAKYLEALCEAGFSADAYYWSEFTLKLTPNQESDPDLTAARLLVSLNMGDLQKVAKLRAQLGENISRHPLLGVHLIWDDILREKWESARATRNLLESPRSDIEDHLILIEVALKYHETGREAAMALAEQHQGTGLKDDSNQRSLARIVEYLLKPDEPSLGLIGALPGMPRNWDHIATLAIQKFQPELMGSQDKGISAFAKILRTRLCGYPASLILSDTLLSPETSLAEYAGNYGFDLESEYNWQPGIKRIDFVIDPEGNVKGTIDKWELTGTVDRYGNLDLRMIVGGKPSSAVMAKIPSIKVMQSDAEVKWTRCVRFAVLENRPLLAHFLAKFNLKM